jgi:hypothetical protein
MTRESFSARRRQLLALGAAAAGALTAPALVMAGGDPVVQERGGKIVVSGRIIGATGARPLAGAQVEIWQADARGMRLDATREVTTADGDGRYFAVLNGAASRLHYRVSHKDHTTRVAQLHVTSARQREATMTRDHEGTMRNLRSASLAPAYPVS